MEQEKTPAQQWLDTATQPIRFPPDRKGVERELRGHLEDKLVDLQRLFPDADPQELERRAVSTMGEPEALGRQLAKLHRPWLGWAWQWSRRLVVVLVVLLVLDSVLPSRHGGANPMWDDKPFVSYVAPLAVQPDKAQLGGYTFCIMQAVYDVVPGGDGTDNRLCITLRVSSPKFWQRIDYYTVLAAAQLETKGGTWATMSGQLRGEDGRTILQGGNPAGYGLCYWDVQFYLYDGLWQAGDWARVRFDFELGSVELAAQVGEVAP